MLIHSRDVVQVGDFAILLRAGFDRWSAARMQLSTALVGILGACFALCAYSPQGTGETRPTRTHLIMHIVVEVAVISIFLP